MLINYIQQGEPGALGQKGEPGMVGEPGIPGK